MATLILAGATGAKLEKHKLQYFKRFATMIEPRVSKRCRTSELLTKNYGQHRAHWGKEAFRYAMVREAVGHLQAGQLELEFVMKGIRRPPSPFNEFETLFLDLADQFQDTAT